MAKKIIEQSICDICKKEKDTRKLPTMVKWLTEQTEGKYVEPYYQLAHLDVCDECLESVVKIEGIGVQGNNEFRIKK